MGNETSRKKPFIIMIGHEKGGTGKSTLSTHLSVGLMYYNKAFKVSIIDLDMRQSGSFAFFKTRNSHNAKIPIPNFDGLKESSIDSRSNSFQEDLNNLKSRLNNFTDSDFIIIDTAGSYTNFVVASMFFTDLLITPITESFLDINAIVRFDQSALLLHGPFADVVFEQKKIRARDGIPQLKWVIVINRASTTNNEHSQNCMELLNKIKDKLDFEIGFKIYDRSVYKELFQHGLTVFDLPRLVYDISLLRVKAHEEMTNFVQKIIELSNEVSCHIQKDHLLKEKQYK